MEAKLLYKNVVIRKNTLLTNKTYLLQCFQLFSIQIFWLAHLVAISVISVTAGERKAAILKVAILDFKQ